MVPMKTNVHANASFQKASNHQWEWAHLNWLAQIPPTEDGSYNHLIWDLMKHRNPRDLLISEYFPNSFHLAKSSDCAVVQIEAPQSFVGQGVASTLLRKTLSHLRFGNQATPFVREAAAIIQRVGCKRILLWDNIVAAPTLRRLLPDITIAYAQRHYDYPPQITHEHYGCCDILVTQTRGQARLAFQRMHRLTSLVVSIPNGAELDLFKPVTLAEKCGLREQLGLPKESLIAIFPSKLAPHKGTRYLREWIGICANRFPNVFFLVVGKLHADLPTHHRRELCSMLEGSSNVKWLKGVARSDMPPLYKAADFCLMPCTWREGFSMAATEALAAGLPLIAPSTGCYSEILRDGYNGLVCRQEYLLMDGLRAIEKLSAEPKLLSVLGRNAREYAMRCLSRDTVLANFEALFEGRYLDIDDKVSEAWTQIQTA